MADTYSSSLRLLKMETNSHKNEWGAELNAGMIDMIDEAVGGVVSISLASGGATLTTANGETDQARNAVIVISGTGGVARTLTIPAVEKTYTIDNRAGTSTVLVKVDGAGTGVSVLRGTMAKVYSSGSEVYRLSVSGWGLMSSTTGSGTALALSLDVTGQAFTDALVVLKQITVDASNTKRVGVRGAGGTAALTSLGVSGSTTTGAFHIPRYKADAGIMMAKCSALSADATIGTLGDGLIEWRMASGLTQFDWDGSGANITGGTAEVWLR